MQQIDVKYKHMAIGLFLESGHVIFHILGSTLSSSVTAGSRTCQESHENSWKQHRPYV